MPAKPPPIPALAYERVIKVAKFDGYSILFVAGVGALMSAMGGNMITTIAAVLAAGAGALEIHGSQRLERGDDTAVTLLVRAQLLLLLVILAYAIYQLTHFDAVFFKSQIPIFRAETASFYERFKLANPYEQISDNELMMLIKVTHSLTYMVVGIVTCIYQGLMARYYHKRRAVIAQALDELG